MNADGKAPLFDWYSFDWYSFLGRPRLSFPLKSRDMLQGQSILITGAGGSIGSALSLELAAIGTRLMLLDSSEQALYRLQKKFSAAGIAAHTVLGSVNDSALLNEIFALHRPELIFHAAAHKHVSLLEAQPLAAIANNALGTQTLIECADRHGHARLVLLSTDKAVAPSCVLGAAKRIAELLTLASGGVVARLGNVLGTEGSVVETFVQQIAAGGPITITDAAAERYFLTCEEAVDFLMHAAASASQVRLFVPRLPRSHSVASLAGFLTQCMSPDVEIPIVFGQLRPGDKLREAMWSAEEMPVANGACDCIEVQSPSVDKALLRRNLQALEEAVRERDLAQAITIVRRLVPDYVPSTALAALMEQSSCKEEQA
jgi:FlaA1/EpsC-like NDP-sugar epimerase